jgi:HSP20 family molecular chaperone IbpA
MADIMRVETLRDLVSFRGAMDLLFDETLGGSLGSYGPVGTPAVNMYQTEEDVVLKATLPGVAANATSRSR